MAYLPPTPKVIIRPQMHVIHCTGVDVNTDDGVIEIRGWPVLTETLWPNLTYPTYRERPLEHGEILPLCMEFEGPLRRHTLEATAVVDLWGDYRAAADYHHGLYWYVQSCEPCHEPRLNLVAMCPWKVQFRPPRGDDAWLGYDGDNAAWVCGRRVEEFHA